MFKLVGVSFAPVLILQEPPWGSFQGQGGWGQAQHVMQGRSRCEKSVLCEWSWHELVLVVSYPSAASEPSLLSATWICPAALLCLRSVHVFAKNRAVAFPF